MKTELVFKSTKGNTVTSSLLVAQKFGKQHKDVLGAIRRLAENSADVPKIQQMFYETQQLDFYGRLQNVFIMNKDGFSLLVMGFTGKKALQFKVDFIEAFNKMESITKSGAHQIPQSFAEALQLAAKQAEQIEQQQNLLEEQKPAVVFTQSVTNADTHITVRELAKLICQNGVPMGERRLYDWMVENKYLMRHRRWSKSKNRYQNDCYEPYQNWNEKGLFFTKETVIGTGESSFIRPTTYITGAGQYHFINKFIN